MISSAGDADWLKVSPPPDVIAAQFAYWLSQIIIRCMINYQVAKRIYQSLGQLYYIDGKQMS